MRLFGLPLRNPTRPASLVARGEKYDDRRKEGAREVQYTRKAIVMVFGVLDLGW